MAAVGVNFAGYRSVSACLELVIDLHNALSVGTHRVVLAGDHLDRHILGDLFVPILGRDVLQHVEQVSVTGCREQEAAFRVCDVFLYVLLIYGEPLKTGVALELFVISPEKLIQTGF